MRRFGLSPLALALFAAVLAQTSLGFAQAPPKKCAPVSPKNPQEALMMEQTTDKAGCWIRDKSTGQLVFIGSKAPDQAYVPLVKGPRSAPTVKPSCQTSTGGGGTGITGKWLWEEKCVTECPKGMPPESVGAETLTITSVGAMLFQISFGSYPGANECMIPVRLTQITPVGSSTTYVKASGTAAAQQYCGTPPTIEVETRGANLFVRMRRTDVWEGTACRTSVLPGVWIDHNPFDPKNGLWLQAGQQLNGPF